jgi:uncharacterized protein (UPF0333 family)
LRSFLLVAVLLAMLIGTFLVVRDMNSRTTDKDGKATITAIEKADRSRKKAEEAGREMEKRLEKILEE